MDVTADPGLSGRFMVTALPTIFHVKDGVFRQYRGARDKDAFISFIEDKKYEELETVPDWKRPDSLQMTAVSYFFKMSMMLRNAHQMITEDYGYAPWVSYVIFAGATIFVGALLGVILVCCVDWIFPYKASQQQQQMMRQMQQQQQQKAKDSDIEDDDDEDDDDEDDDDDDVEDEPAQEAAPEPEEEKSVRKRRPKKAD